MTPKEQLEKWCKGESIHNHERDECCPDFSCCNKNWSAPMSERLLFKDRPELRDQMLLGFLAGALSSSAPKVNVYIAGSIEGEA
jgi:hypothetical protein